MRPPTALGVVALAVTAGAFLAGCTGDGEGTKDEKRGESAATSSSAPDTKGGTYGVLELGSSRGAGELGRTKNGPEGESFVLTGLRRVGTDRVVVEGVAKSGTSAGSWGFFNELGYSGSAYPFGGDFGGVTLKRTGDAATYLPLRNADKSCVCTGIPANHTDGDEIPVYVLMSAPEANDGFTVTVKGLGSIPNLMVTTP